MVFWQHQPRPSVQVRYLNARPSPPPSRGSYVTSTFCPAPAASRGRSAALLLPENMIANNSSGNILHKIQLHCVEIGFQFRIIGEKTLPVKNGPGESL